jgi:2',3'-cyclic-nucleotide 2'-phosphodiesterase / 3'-nucleotidase / 5'-nucleotidase
MKMRLPFRFSAALVLSVAVLALLVAPASLLAQANVARVFDIIEVTDFHGNLEDTRGLPVASVLARDIEDVIAANPLRTLVIGGGDFYQGTPMSNVLRGVPVQKVFSSIGMAVTALGNHELDWGFATLRDTTMKGALYSVVCANLYDKTTKQRPFDPYKIVVKDGVRMALVGAITIETPSIVLAEMVANFTVTDPVAEINAVVREIRDQKKADVVFALIHEGGSVSSKGIPTGPIFDIAKSLVGVDAVFGGHSHTIVNTKVGTLPVVIANNAGKGYIDMHMTLDARMMPRFDARYVAIDTDAPNGYKAASPVSDPAVKAIVAAAKEEVGGKFKEVIGSTPANLTRVQDVQPYGESYLGNWACDVTRAKVAADVGIQNNGGIRIDVPKGDITVGTVFTIMPFDNTICVFTLTKAQLMGILEQAFNDEDKAKNLTVGKGIQVSGIKVIYDSSLPSLSRVVDITHGGGSPIAATDVLKVATNNFLATGGDGFLDFAKYTYVDTNVLVRDAMLEDVRHNGRIAAVMDKRIQNAGKGP